MKIRSYNIHKKKCQMSIEYGYVLISTIIIIVYYHRKKGKKKKKNEANVSVLATDSNR